MKKEAGQFDLVGDCVDCEKPIYGFMDYQETPRGLVDNNCYAKALGDIIEQHPLGGLGGLSINLPATPLKRDGYEA